MPPPSPRYRQYPAGVRGPCWPVVQQSRPLGLQTGFVRFFVFPATGRAAVWHCCGHKCSISGLCFCKVWGVWPHSKSSFPELLMLFFPCERFHEADEAGGGPGDLGQRGVCQEETTVRPHWRYPFLLSSSLPLGHTLGVPGLQWHPAGCNSKGQPCVSTQQGRRGVSQCLLMVKAVVPSPHMKLLRKAGVGKLPLFKQVPETVEDGEQFINASRLSWNHSLRTEQQSRVSYNIYRFISIMP